NLNQEKWTRKADKRVHRTFQESKTGEPNICSVWCQGEDGKITSLSTNSNNNHMGHGSPSLDNLHYENEGFRGNGASRPEEISFQNANCLCRQNHNDEYGKFASPINSKCNDFNGKGEDHKIYVQGISSHVTKDQQFSSTVEGEIYTDPTMTPCHFVIPNIQSIEERVSETMSPMPK
ncbi:7797_t:CDS:2, partial [Funneliformis caledonium]